MIRHSDVALGPDLVFGLARQRLFLTERGRIRSRVIDGQAERDVTLPGCVVRVHWQGNGGTVKLLYPTMRDMSTWLDTNDPEMFASLLHNVDVSIRRELPNFPTTGFAIADAAALAERGMVSILNDIPTLKGAPFLWHSNERIREHVEGLVERGVVSADLRNRFLAGKNLPKLHSDPDWSSLIRWNLQTDEWIMQAEGRTRSRWPAGDREWVRIETESGVIACSRAVGQVEGFVRSQGNEFYALMDNTHRISLFAVCQAGRLCVVHERKEAGMMLSPPEVDEMISILERNVIAASPSASL